MTNNTKGYNAVSVLERAPYTKKTFTERAIKNHSVFELSVYGRGSNDINNLWDRIRNKRNTH